ncbi:MAG TPA: DDE-type integrase/transposase/recombinase [Candidatus Nitrosocosmicus sp.]
MIDETIIKAGSELVWIWIIIEPKHKEVLVAEISKKRNMFVAERFLSQVVNKYGLHSVSSDDGTWYPKACRFFEDKSSYSLIFREKLDRKNNTIYKR